MVLHPKYLDVQAPTATMNRHRHSRCHYEWNSGSTPAGTNNPPHRRACGTTTSRWLTAAHSCSSDNDLRSGRPNSSSDDLRADAAAIRPSPMSPLEGQGQAIKAKEPEARSADGSSDPVDDKDFSSHLRPAVPQGPQPGSWTRQPDSGAGPANGRPGQAPADEASFRANSASVHADTAASGFGSSQSSRGFPLTKQEKHRAARPTEPRDSYASGIRIPHSSPSARGNSHLVKRFS